MFVHIWRMRGRRKKAQQYEKFGRQVTLPALKKLEGCRDAYFIKVFEARKPEYLWLVFWKDRDALEAARTNPVWREQIRKFEEGAFYKTIPLELVCEGLASFADVTPEKPRKVEPTPKPERAKGAAFTAPTVEGE
jgi:heme-degrading monooxygenase HmoA